MLLQALERHHQNLYIEYPDSFKDVHNPTGKATSPDAFDIFLYTDGAGAFLNELITKFTSLTNLIESTGTFDLADQHKIFFLNELKIVLGSFFDFYHPIVYTIHDKIQYLPEKEDTSLDEYVRTKTGSALNRISFNSNINSYSKFLLSYYELIERLKTLNLIQTTTTKTVPAKDFFAPAPINFDLVNKIRQKSLFDIKTTPTLGENH